MLNKVAIKNFRNLEDITISFSKITVLIGANGTGKSGIFHALCALKQTFESDGSPDRLLMVGNEVNLGSRNQVVSRHEDELNIDMSVDFDFKPEFSLGESKTGYVSYRLIDTKLNGKREITSTLGNISGAIGFEAISGSEIIFKNNGNDEIFRISDSRGLSVIGTFDNEDLHLLSNYFGTRMVESFLQSLQYVPVQRGTSQFKTIITPGKPRFINNSQGNIRLARDVMGTIHYDHALTDTISSYMERLFKKGIRPALVENGLGNFSDGTYGYEGDGPGIMGTSEFYDKTISSFAANSGFGLNQILFLFVQLLGSPEGSVVMIEEPEVSLHPVAQRELMDIFIDIANKQNKQIVLTTHSEHLAMASFEAVRTKKLAESELGVYSLEQDEKGKSTATKIDSLEGALKRFLGNDSRMIMWYIEALGKTDKWLKEGVLSEEM